MYTFGYVGIVGFPNAGKSTLINALVGEKVAIVTEKRQTTRYNILGILNGEDYQVVFIDTPGIHHTRLHLDKYMMKNVRSAVAGSDLILYLHDLEREFSTEEKEYLENLKAKGQKVFLVGTKSDKGKSSDEYDICISSVKGTNLDKLKKMIIEALPKSEEKNFEFSEEEYTNQTMSDIARETVRECALKVLNEEIPHGIAVEIIRFDERQDIIFIDADIICEKQSHKGIIIGKGGRTLKKIAIDARLELEKLFDIKIMLKTFVKVEEGWRNNPNKMREIGYNTGTPKF